MNEKSKWFEVEATVDAEAADAVVFALTELGAEGTSYSLVAAGKDAESVIVSGYFQSAPDASAVQSKALEALEIYGFEDSSLHSIEIREVVDQDWLAEWKKHWKPTVTERFIVAPPWQEIDPEGKIVIRIEPKMAFGTGTHETTRLCLKAIETLYEPGMSFLDVGTGTGILAIAAAKLSEGAADVEGCDTDPEAVSAAVENAELNDCPEIVFRTGSIDDKTPEFDFLCANLTSDVILPLLPLFLEKSRKTLVMSGILAEKSTEVNEALRELGAADAEVKADGEWVSVIVRRSF
ncbi:MAG: 50S ribosomal protein L11 methyltransferase [Acidobacteriota bacterium]|nr:MAG: 50S ribosomal protein L11 methyltransferase [Acidobacteriota bacterium]